MFLTSKPNNDSISNADTFSTWDVTSVDTRITGYSFSSVKSSIVEHTPKKLRSISDLSEFKIDYSKL